MSLRTSLTCLLLLLLALQVWALGFGDDKRQPMPRQGDEIPWREAEVPWNAIGKVICDEGVGSGCLVGPNLVLTAKHMVFDGDSRKPFSGLGFLSATKSPRGQQEWSTVKRVYFVGDRSYKVGTFQYDWALLVLDRSLGNIFGWVGIKTFESNEDPFACQVCYYGYASNPREHTLMYDRNAYPYTSQGRFHISRPPNLLIHDCATWPGSSGGPLMVWSHGKPWIVGVHVAGYIEEKLPTDMARRYNGGFLQVYSASDEFFSKYGNRCVPMDRPLDTLKDLEIPTHHRISVENQTMLPIQAAVVFHSDNYQQQETRGLVTIAPMQTQVLVTERDGLTANEFYFHAHSDDGYTWGSSQYRMNIRPETKSRSFVRLQLDEPNHKVVLTRKNY